MRLGIGAPKETATAQAKQSPLKSPELHLGGASNDRAGKAGHGQKDAAERIADLMADQHP
jgi:hypothetical protein